MMMMMTAVTMVNVYDVINQLVLQLIHTASIIPAH